MTWAITNAVNLWQPWKLPNFTLGSDLINLLSAVCISPWLAPLTSQFQCNVNVKKNHVALEWQGNCFSHFSQVCLLPLCQVGWTADRWDVFLLCLRISLPHWILRNGNCFGFVCIYQYLKNMASCIPSLVCKHEMIRHISEGFCSQLKKCHSDTIVISAVFGAR